MHIEILDSAEADLLEGVSFYERQERGLGSYFLDTISSDIESLRIYGGIHAKKWGYFRALSKRFPYSIYYKHHNDLIKVFAVLDDRRDPEQINKRLKDRA